MYPSRIVKVGQEVLRKDMDNLHRIWEPLTIKARQKMLQISYMVTNYFRIFLSLDKTYFLKKNSRRLKAK